MSRRGKTAYFEQVPDGPPPLVVQSNRRVRFEEVDPLGIVWHGRYPSYIEDGRAAFGEKYGLTYTDMYRERFLAPIVQMHIDYLSPLAFPDEFTITASLYWTESVRLNFQYLITGGDGRMVATGYTVQLLTNLDREVLLVRPAFVEEFCTRWRDAGSL